ncbi:ketoacyl-ACP synthase III [Frateuria sp. GZRe12]|uniref:ketoacyl-ACP synthase III n=1 Tax=Frateuria sp. GZRe12 TaxID=3351533 RepID=UPI003EDC3A61
MIGIRAVGSYVPDTLISNLDRAAEAGKDAAFVTDKIGFQSLARRDPSQESSDLCVEAFADLQSRTGLDTAAVDCVIVCTQNPDGHGIPHTSAVVQGKLGLGNHVAAFDISLGCSGYVYGLSVATSFMQANGLRNGLLFTADPYSKILDPADWDTELLFGDAATATWLTDDPVYACRPAMFGTDGSLGHSITVPAPGEKLRMLGSNVFKFTMTVVPEQITRYLEREGLSIEDIDLFLLHQGSRFIVESMTRRMGLPPEKVPFGAASTGNTVSSSIPLLLKDYLDAPPPRVLMSGFGVGLSWATMALARTSG